MMTYFELCKPKVVGLMLLTAWIGMLLSPLPEKSFAKILLALIGIGCMAGAGGVANHLADRHYDVLMKRTEKRPIPTGKVKPLQALYFCLSLGALGFAVLVFYINKLTALLTLASFASYAIVYTMFLKHMTSQNIVIGGISGAMPPLLGWCAMSAQVEIRPILLVMIIFIWTPVHFWALAIHRYDDYKNAEIPMLPVTHGIPFTKLSILLYTFLMIGATLLPFMIGMNGWIYLIGCCILNGIFLYYVVRLYSDEEDRYALATFKYSVGYLGLLFLLMLLDHTLRGAYGS